VLLLGDAAHSFPPDIGQGVNAALADVCTLEECLVNPGFNTLQEAMEEVSIG